MSAKLSSILAAAIRLHDVTGTRVLDVSLIEAAAEDYRAGHPEAELASSELQFLIEKITLLQAQRAIDSGEITP